MIGECGRCRGCKGNEWVGSISKRKVRYMGEWIGWVGRWVDV